jgi:hypothetical protein
MRLPALLLSLLAVAACTADPPPAPAVSASPAPGSVDCAHVIGGVDAPSEGAQVILDAVSLPSRVLEPQDSGEPGRLFAKQGLVVRAGTAVELTVAPAAVGKATIGWGSPGPQGTTIRVPACQGAHAWLAFAGGYTVREPLCVPLIVRVNGREEHASVSVGAECA